MVLFVLRLQNNEAEVSDGTHEGRVIRISNDLYGSYTVSAYEMDNGFLSRH